MFQVQNFAMFLFFPPRVAGTLVFLLQCYDYFYCLQYKGFSMGAKGEPLFLKVLRKIWECRSLR